MVNEHDAFREYLDRQGDVSNGSITPEVAGKTPDEQAAIAERKRRLIETLGMGTRALLDDRHEVVVQGRTDALFREMTGDDDTFDKPSGD